LQSAAACLTCEINVVASLMKEEMSLAVISAWIFFTVATVFSMSAMHSEIPLTSGSLIETKD